MANEKKGVKRKIVADAHFRIFRLTSIGHQACCRNVLHENSGDGVENKPYINFILFFTIRQPKSERVSRNTN